MIKRISWKKAIFISFLNIILGYVVFSILEIYLMLFFIILIEFGIRAIISSSIFIIIIKSGKLKIKRINLINIIIITSSLDMSVVIIFIVFMAGVYPLIIINTSILIYGIILLIVMKLKIKESKPKDKISPIYNLVV